MARKVQNRTPWLSAQGVKVAGTVSVEITNQREGRRTATIRIVTSGEFVDERAQVVIPAHQLDNSELESELVGGGGQSARTRRR